ncbi:MAG: hypothetical protein M3O02_01920 [Acidobacteriota bacterium]|nr:hypothetical protein [Acidobacteriota bacterium]
MLDDRFIESSERSRKELQRLFSSLPALPNAHPDFRKARAEDLHHYLDLLTGSRMETANALARSPHAQNRSVNAPTRHRFIPPPFRARPRSLL